MGTALVLVLAQEQRLTTQGYAKTSMKACGAQVRLLLAGKDATPSECALHPGRIVCQVERLLSA